MSAIMLWVLYCIGVSAVLAVGAAALEQGARAARRGGRFAWLAALIASAGFPLAAYYRPVVVNASTAGDVGLAIGQVSAVAPPDVAGPALPIHPGIALWLVAALLVISFVLVSYARLAVARRSWESARLDETDVLLSEDTGPAALGVLHTAIVLPRWVLALESRARSLMVLHEREHVRAGDTRVTLAGVLLVALMPWNVVMWYMLRRLRLAIELDCDARVLARQPDPRRYGAVLLEVGRRKSAGGFALSTLVEPRSQLERRIRLMAEWPGKTNFSRAAALAALAVLVTGGAYAMKSPLYSPDAVVVRGADDGRTAAGATDAASATGSTAADTIKPRLLNAAEVVAAAERGYPPLLKDAGIVGNVTLWVYVDTAGRVTKTQVYKGSGYPALDQAALRTSPTMRFAPATFNGRRVAAWAELVVPFRISYKDDPTDVPPPPPPAPDTDLPLRPASPPPPRPASPPPPRGVDVSVRPANEPPPQVDARGRIFRVYGTDTVYFAQEKRNPPAPSGRADTVVHIMPKVPAPSPRAGTGEPVFTPVTKQPALTNQAEVAQAVRENYPPLLKNAGIGGTAIVWFYIDETGRSVKQQINKPSGYPALDAAALKVAEVLRFTPGEKDGKPVPVWVQIPIMFKVD